MADGYLESHYAEYEKKKAEWLKRKNKFNPKNYTDGRKNPKNPS